MNCLKSALPALFSFVLIVGTTACPPKNDTVVDAGNGSDAGSDGGSDAGTDGGFVATLGESCENPFELVSGTQVTGDSATAADDFQSDCADPQNPAQGDVVYHFTVTAPSGVEISVSGPDSIISLYKDACTTTGAVGACVDDTVDTPETMNFSLLDPGDYYLVIDSWDGGAPYTVDLTVTPGGICVGDALEPDNGTADTATDASSSDLDTVDVGDPNTPGPDPFRLSVCSGDTDYFLIGHMGGNLHIGAASVDTIQTEVFAAVFDATAGTYSEGASAGPAPYDGADEPRGHYLLKVWADTVPVTGIEYSINHTHSCQGDADDVVNPADDDESYETAIYNFYATPDAPVDRSVCLSDKDVFVVENVAPGDITLDLKGGANVIAEVAVVTHDASGTPSFAAYSGTLTDVVNGNDRQMVIKAAPVGEYSVTVSTPVGSTAMDIGYSFNVTFAGLAGAPANDDCAGAETLVPATTPSAVNGRTIGANDSLVGPCGNEDVSITNGGPGANDVFYALNMAVAGNLQVELDGSLTGFSSQVYLLGLSSPACPADLTALPVVNDFNGAPGCATGSYARLRYLNLPAGDYLVAVDGRYSEPVFIFPESWSEGGFSLSATLFPGAFPVPQVCQNAQAITLPALGTPLTLSVDNTTLNNEIRDYGDCAGGGGMGNEQVWSITPGADASIKVSAGGPGGYDTILAIRETNCDMGTMTACNDDNDPPGNLGSQITASLIAGTTYYLEVDGWDGSELGNVDVVIELQ